MNTTVQHMGNPQLWFLEELPSCCGMLYCCMQCYLSTVLYPTEPLPCIFKVGGQFWIGEVVCHGLQNFSSVDRLLWAARINVDRVDFSFAGNGTTLPLSQDADWVQVTTLLQCKERHASTLAVRNSTCLSCTDTCCLELDLIPLLHICMAMS